MNIIEYFTLGNLYQLLSSVIQCVFFTDVNECTDLEGACHEKAECSNTEGSFTCSCSIGYTGGGVKTCYGNRKYRSHFLSFRCYVAKLIAELCSIFMSTLSNDQQQDNMKLLLIFFCRTRSNARTYFLLCGFFREKFYFSVSKNIY